jgi:hypothetical protein
MEETSKRGFRIEWLCQVLFTLNLFAVVSGYISILQAQRQLVSPLIPKYLVNEIALGVNNIMITASLFCAGFFLLGLWFYSFKKKIAAVVLWGLALISYLVIGL